MKRHTKPDPAGSITEPHRHAFEHALRVLKAHETPDHFTAKRRKDNRGLTVRWSTEVFTEPNSSSGRSEPIRAEFSRTRGFRFTLTAANSHITHGGIALWQTACAGIAEKKRFLPHRLAAYRERLCFWQKTTPWPLTFRDFNRLLAALSYDLTLTDQPP